MTRVTEKLFMCQMLMGLFWPLITRDFGCVAFSGVFWRLPKTARKWLAQKLGVVLPHLQREVWAGNVHQFRSMPSPSESCVMLFLYAFGLLSVTFNQIALNKKDKMRSPPQAVSGIIPLVTANRPCLEIARVSLRIL